MISGLNAQLQQTVNADSMGPTDPKNTYQQANKRQLSQDYAEKYRRMRNRIDSELKKNTVVVDAVKVPQPPPPKGVRAEGDATE